MAKKSLFFSILFLCLFSFFAGCNHLFYNPTPHEYLTPAYLDLEYEDVYFQSKDGTKLHGWFLPAQSGNAKGTVVHFHGNAENLTHFFFHVFYFPQRDYNLFMFDYRGYGKSEGVPETAGIYQDALAALAYIKTRPDVDSQRLVLFGQSLGGALVLRMMGAEKPQGVVAVATEGAFYAHRQIAEEKMQEVWFTRPFKYPLAQLLFEDDYAAAPVISNISPVPLLVIHGKKDDIVPYHHGQQIFEAAREPKWMWTIENGRHIQMLTKYRSLYRDRLIDFFDEHLGGVPSG